MNNKLITVLAALCAVFIVVILCEWLYAAQLQKQTLSAVDSTEATAVDETMPELALIQESEDSFEDLVNRPLFVKGRKPVEEPQPEEEQVVAPVVNNFDWQLNGVYTTKAGLSALVSRVTTRVPKDNYRRIVTGTDLDGWKLTEVHPDKIILKQGGQQKNLDLRKAKPKELPKTDAPNPASAPNNPRNKLNPNGPDSPDILQPPEGEPEINNENL